MLPRDHRRTGSAGRGIKPSHDELDRTLVHAGAWLAIVALLYFPLYEIALAMGPTTYNFATQRLEGHIPLEDYLHPAACAMFVAGLVSVVAGVVRGRSRRRRGDNFAGS